MSCMSYLNEADFLASLERVAKVAAQNAQDVDARGRFPAESINALRRTGHPTAVGRAQVSRWRPDRSSPCPRPHSFAAAPRSTRPAAPFVRRCFHRRYCVGEFAGCFSFTRAASCEASVTRAITLARARNRTQRARLLRPTRPSVRRVVCATAGTLRQCPQWEKFGTGCARSR